MGLGINEKGFKMLCDLYVINKLACIKLDDRYLYYEKVNYNKLHEFSHKDDFLFDLYQTNVLDYVYDMYRKFYVRPSKEMTDLLLCYCHEEIKKKYKLHIKNDGVGGIITSLGQNTKSILNWLVSKK